MTEFHISGKINGCLIHRSGSVYDLVLFYSHFISWWQVKTGISALLLIFMCVCSEILVWIRMFNKIFYYCSFPGTDRLSGNLIQISLAYFHLAQRLHFPVNARLKNKRTIQICIVLASSFPVMNWIYEKSLSLEGSGTTFWCGSK